MWPVQHSEHVDLRGHRNMWSMLICVANAAGGAYRCVWRVQHLGHADLCDQCNTWGMLIFCGQCSSWSIPIGMASAAVGACRSVWPVQHLEHGQHSLAAWPLQRSPCSRPAGGAGQGGGQGGAASYATIPGMLVFTRENDHHLPSSVPGYREFVAPVVRGVWPL